MRKMTFILVLLQLHNFEETKEWCGKAIEMDGHNADALCARAEAYIDQELYDEGTTVAHMITL